MVEEKKKKPNGVVGVMVFKDGKVLIGKRKETASHGKGEYSFPGGHMEFGESFEEAIRRETLEESGVTIKNLKFSCVANVNQYNVVLTGFIAGWDSGEIRTIEEENIGDWFWCDFNNLPEPLFYPTAILIDSYKTGKNYYDKD
ncbi:MAG: NUDIX domain-containing protein [Candidatus Paceibacterota bacterium]